MACCVANALAAVATPCRRIASTPSTLGWRHENEETRDASPGLIGGGIESSSSPPSPDSCSWRSSARMRAAFPPPFRSCSARRCSFLAARMVAETISFKSSNSDSFSGSLVVERFFLSSRYFSMSFWIRSLASRFLAFATFSARLLPMLIVESRFMRRLSSTSMVDALVSAPKPVSNEAATSALWIAATSFTPSPHIITRFPHSCFNVSMTCFLSSGVALATIDIAARLCAINLPAGSDWSERIHSKARPLAAREHFPPCSRRMYFLTEDTVTDSVLVR
mmetsp:Transcript_157/g.321  ORF Transcript_157/g.321 Transcript_157/m.321 type:complete len:279 (-) Transcript_157:2113-2949(-)